MFKLVSKILNRTVRKYTTLVKSPTAIFDLLKQIDPTKDWLFIPFLLSFALLKDILDIAFASLGPIGIIISFVLWLMIFTLTIQVLLLTGSSLANLIGVRFALGLCISFITEALVVSWLPLAALQILILYIFVLWDRTTELQKEGYQEENCEV